MCLFEGSINGNCFYAWVKQQLLPHLKGNEVIVMDNIAFHKRKDTLKAILDKGCEILFLPTYSPDLNPIEHAWAKAKAIRKKYSCSIDEIFTQYLT